MRNGESKISERYCSRVNGLGQKIEACALICGVDLNEVTITQ